MSKYSELMVVEKRQYKSLMFDLDQSDHVDDCYMMYHIPTGEKVVLYADNSRWSTMSWDGKGTIITDEAIYFHPSHREWGSDNRIPLSDLCSYVIFQENASDTVHLISKERDQSIFGRTVNSKDTTGSELVSLLSALQKKIRQSNTREQAAYERTLAHVMGLIKGSFRENGLLPERSLKLLDILVREKSFAAEVAYVLAENEYRHMNEAGYFRFLDTLRMQPYISAALIEQLQRPDELFLESFLQDISNPNALYLTRSLIETYTNLKTAPRLSMRQCVILCFLCVRFEDWAFFDEVWKLIAHVLPEEMRWRIQSFRARFANEKMFGVYEKLMGNKPLTSMELGWKDALGLTPLHYALILRNRNRVMELLDEGEWNRFHSPFERDKLVDTAYQYAFLASVLYDDIELIERVIDETTPLFSSLHRSMKQMDFFIFLEEKRMEESGDEACKKRIFEYESMKREMRAEMRQMAMEEAQNARKKAQAIIETSHAFSRYLFYLYMDLDGLYRLMADTISSWKVARYKEFYFITPTDRDMGMEARIYPNEESGSFDIPEDNFENPAYRRKREEAERAERAAREARFKAAREAFEAQDAAESWFSAEAHEDILILKKEYRMLVKQYHPDVCGGAKATRIMQAIMDERAQILEAMETA
ncbi:MAG: J domain-containing protein [Lachnospiraceae bacterium]|nr:J domain-containing protein [Lachnospiraceae bacterium]